MPQPVRVCHTPSLTIRYSEEKRIRALLPVVAMQLTPEQQNQVQQAKAAGEKRVHLCLTAE